MEVTNASYCNMKCPGDQSTCGGLYYLSIYLAKASSPKDINFQLVVVSKLARRFLQQYFLPWGLIHTSCVCHMRLQMTDMAKKILQKFPISAEMQLIATAACVMPMTLKRHLSL